MSIEGFKLKDGTTAKYDYEALDNLPVIPSGSGLSDEVKQALLALLEKVAYVDENGQTYYDALETALYPPASLTSISAVFTQGQNVIYDTDSLDTLKQFLVVTAHYDNSTSAVISNYTLSGTLTAGTSTITVTYGGKTTTFIVTVSTLKAYTNSALWLDNLNKATAYSDEGTTPTNAISGARYALSVLHVPIEEETDKNISFVITWKKTMYATMYIGIVQVADLADRTTYLKLNDGGICYNVASLNTYYKEGQGTSYTYEGNVYEGVMHVPAGFAIFVCGTYNHSTSEYIDDENTSFVEANA